MAELGNAGRKAAEELLRESMTRPTEARIYDYYLGGACNFAVDRDFARAQIAKYPDMPMIAQENRAFLSRVVSYLLDHGIRQFVDIGSGVPTEGNVHQIADTQAPGAARVVYVDHDPIAHAHARLLLDRDGDPRRHAALLGDLVDTPALWSQIVDTGLIDLTQPVALLLVAVLHFVPDEREPLRAVRHLTAQLPPGSMLALSHATADGLPTTQRAAAEGVRSDYQDKATNPGVFRTREDISAFFGDWPLLAPGLVWTPLWHKGTTPTYTDDPARAFILAGLAHTPEPRSANA